MPGKTTKRAKARASSAETDVPAEALERGRSVLRSLRRNYSDADCEIDRDNALQLLIGTILAAQSTDVLINQLRPTLFAQYPDAAAFADADLEELEQAIHSTGFFRQKARNVQKACRHLVEFHGGEVPDTMEELVALPGVARKTANVVLGTWFGKNEGVVVDTHVGRLSHRLQLTWTSKDSKDAVKIENDLMRVIPRRSWTFFAHALILHGRRVCLARKPKCDECKLSKLCPTAFEAS